MAYPTMPRPAPPTGSGRNPPKLKRPRGNACGKTDLPARLTGRKEVGRTATPTSGRAGGGTHGVHGVRTYALPPEGGNAVRFRHPAKRGRAPSGHAQNHHSKSVARCAPTAPGYRREPPTWQGEASRPPLHPPLLKLSIIDSLVVTNRREVKPCHPVTLSVSTSNSSSASS